LKPNLVCSLRQLILHVDGSSAVNKLRNNHAVVTYDSIKMDNDNVVFYNDSDNNGDDDYLIIIIEYDIFIGPWN
jgi:hypothetical protein